MVSSSMGGGFGFGGTLKPGMGAIFLDRRGEGGLLGGYAACIWVEMWVWVQEGVCARQVKVTTCRWIILPVLYTTSRRTGSRRLTPKGPVQRALYNKKQFLTRYITDYRSTRLQCYQYTNTFMTTSFCVSHKHITLQVIRSSGDSI